MSIDVDDFMKQAGAVYEAASVEYECAKAEAERLIGRTEELRTKLNKIGAMLNIQPVKTPHGAKVEHQATKAECTCGADKDPGACGHSPDCPARVEQAKPRAPRPQKKPAFDKPSAGERNHIGEDGFCADE